MRMTTFKGISFRIYLKISSNSNVKRFVRLYSILYNHITGLQQANVRRLRSSKILTVLEKKIFPMKVRAQ